MMRNSQNGSTPRVDIDTVIFCATDIEFDAARNTLHECPEKSVCGVAEAASGKLGTLSCLIVSGGLSKKRFAAALDGVFQAYHPRLFFNFGAAGAVSPLLSIGTPTLPHEILAYSWPDLALEGRPIECPAAPHLVSLNPALRLTRAGSCPRDVRDGETCRRLTESLRLDTTDWETYRLADACRNHRIPFLALRCITDHADNRTGLDYARHAEKVLEQCALLLEPLARDALAFYYPRKNA